MRELQYRPLASARALRGRGHAIGILMAEIANPFFPEILDGVAQALDKTDYQHSSASVTPRRYSKNGWLKR